MQTVKNALLKEANDWLEPYHTISDWCTHCLINASNDLTLAYQSVDIEDDEEYEDYIDQLIGEVWTEVTTGDNQ